MLSLYNISYLNTQPIQYQLSQCNSLYNISYLDAQPI